MSGTAPATQAEQVTHPPVSLSSLLEDLSSCEILDFFGRRDATDDVYKAFFLDHQGRASDQASA